MVSNPSLNGVLAGGRHCMAVRIHREDTDFSGIVYHASYVRFLERGRTNYLRLLGMSQGRLWDAGEGSGAGLAFVVRAMTLDFRRSARLDDLLTVLTAPDEVKGASAILAQSIVCGDTPMLEARVRIALVSDGRPRPLPRMLRTAMQPPGAAADPVRIAPRIPA